MDFECPLTEKEIEKCRSYLLRRGQGEPLAYIHGSVDFYHCLIHVTPDVLIPRPETEILVDRIASYLKKYDLRGKKLWDVCTGSGCIGIALKKCFPELDVTLADFSPAALEIAAENAKFNQVQVQMIQGDFLKPFIGQKTDFFVCNPPYIDEQEYKQLDSSVRLFEPRLALVAGITGLEFYQLLAQSLSSHLNRGGAAWFEIGHKQGKKVKELFEAQQWKRISVESDWAGHDRFFFLENE
jgi:release factor glutamine methyltransferase